MNKRIFIIIITILLSSSVFAKTSIDQAITNAAVDIADKCNAKSILMIDDFESPTPAMTLYIREQLAYREQFYSKARYTLDVSLMDNFDKIKITIEKIQELLK